MGIDITGFHSCGHAQDATIEEFFRLSSEQQHVELRAILTVLESLRIEAKRSMGRHYALGALHRSYNWLLKRAHRTPIQMILFCPKCHVQHIDELEPAGSRLNPSAVDIDWAKRPHRTHLCKMSTCGYEFRPTNFATVGVAELPANEKRPERNNVERVRQKG